MIDLYNKAKEELNQRKSQKSDKSLVPNNSIEAVQNSLSNIETHEMLLESLGKDQEVLDEFTIIEKKKKVQKFTLDSPSNKLKRKSFPGQYLSPEGQDDDVLIPMLKNPKPLSYEEMIEKHLESLSVSQSLETSMNLEK